MEDHSALKEKIEEILYENGIKLEWVSGCIDTKYSYNTPLELEKETRFGMTRIQRPTESIASEMMGGFDCDVFIATITDDNMLYYTPKEDLPPI